MSRPTAIVTRRWPEEVEARLSEMFDVRLRTDDTPMSPEELAEAVASADSRHTEAHHILRGEHPEKLECPLCKLLLRYCLQGLIFSQECRQPFAVRDHFPGL